MALGDGENLSVSGNSTSPMGSTNYNTLGKLGIFQNLVPQFDSNSSCTPRYLLDLIDSLAGEEEFSDTDRILIAKSRIRGAALTSLIGNQDLNKEKSWKDFKTKFLDNFEAKRSQAVCQYKFTNLKQFATEKVRAYAQRVITATDEFLGIKNNISPEIKQIYDATILSKFTEGILNEFKLPLITRECKSIAEAINFIELLETNALLTQTDGLNAIQPNIDNTSAVLGKLVQTTHEKIASLTKQIDDMKLKGGSSGRSLDRNLGAQRQEVTCEICHRTNHETSRCFRNPANRQQFGNNRQFEDRSRPIYRGQNDRENYRRENSRGRYGNIGREYQYRDQTPGRQYTNNGFRRDQNYTNSNQNASYNRYNRSGSREQYPNTRRVTFNGEERNGTYVRFQKNSGRGRY